MEIDSASLNVLTPDGRLAVTFRPGLNPEQYDDLWHAITDEQSGVEGLPELLRLMASAWGVQVEIGWS